MIRRLVPTAAVLVSLVGGAAALTACDDASAPVAGEPDGTLRTHEIVPSTPTPEGLAYLQAMAAVHGQADLEEDAAKLQALRSGLALRVPADLPEAEVVRLSVATRIAQAELDGGRAPAAVELLEPMLKPARSLPLDRQSAEALIVLGDAATKSGDDALAAGTYARAIRMMSILRQELER